MESRTSSKAGSASIQLTSWTNGSLTRLSMTWETIRGRQCQHQALSLWPVFSRRVDGVLEIVQNEGLSPAQIKGIRVTVHQNGCHTTCEPRALRLQSRPPSTRGSACIAVWPLRPCVTGCSSMRSRKRRFRMRTSRCLRAASYQRWTNRWSIAPVSFLRPPWSFITHDDQNPRGQSPRTQRGHRAP